MVGLLRLQTGPIEAWPQTEGGISATFYVIGISLCNLFYFPAFDYHQTHHFLILERAGNGVSTNAISITLPRSIRIITMLAAYTLPIRIFFAILKIKFKQSSCKS